MFASRSLGEHLLRGLVGAGALISVPFALGSRPWLALLAVPIAFVALRGCPSCWLMGLIETVALGRGKGGACVDGRCAQRPSSKL